MLEHLGVEVSLDHNLELNGAGVLTESLHRRFKRIAPTAEGWASGVDPDLRALVEQTWRRTSSGGPFDLVGISVETPTALGYAALLAEVARSETDAAVVLGGPGLDHAGEVARACPSLFGLIVEDGEIGIPAVLGAREGLLTPEEVQGLIWLDGDRVRSNVRLYHHRTALAPPAYPGLPLDRYYASEPFGHWGEFEVPPTRMVPYISARGCPYLCAYCADVTDRFFDLEPVDRTV